MISGGKGGSIVTRERGVISEDLEGSVKLELTGAIGSALYSDLVVSIRLWSILSEPE